MVTDFLDRSDDLYAWMNLECTLLMSYEGIDVLGEDTT